MPNGGFVAGPTAEVMEQKRISPRSPRAALEPERMPQPPRRSASARHPLVIVGNAIFTILIVLAIVVGTAVVLGKQRFDTRGPLAEDKVVNIPRGLGIRDIADLLMREGVIDQPWTFVGGVIVLKARDELKFGEYQFPKQASLHDVISTIVEGKVVLHQISVPEGLTSEQIVQRLLDMDILNGNIREVPREGSLLPESYKFTRRTPPRRATTKSFSSGTPRAPTRAPRSTTSIRRMSTACGRSSATTRARAPPRRCRPGPPEPRRNPASRGAPPPSSAASRGRRRR